MRGANPGLELQGQYSGGSAVELFTIGELDRVWVLAERTTRWIYPPHERELTLPSACSPIPARPSTETWNGSWAARSNLAATTPEARCSIANPDGKLRPEMFGTASITVDYDRGCRSSRSALLQLGEQPVVFAQIGTTPAGQLRFERKPIAVDEMSDGAYVPIKNGVERNENIVVNGGVLLLGML